MDHSPRPRHRRRRILRTRPGVLAVSAVAVLTAGVMARGFVGTASAGQAGPVDPTKPGPHRVAVGGYDLGDTVFNGGELRAVVHYPTDVANGSHPLIVISHGLFATCADRDADAAATDARARLDADPAPAPAEKAHFNKIIEDSYAKLFRWPCAAGTPPIPSFRGYDDLGQRLASHGFVVASISANGINGGQHAEADEFEARSNLINKHLAMWRQLSDSGGGPLATASAGVAFRGHVDMSTVGTIGHSKGGRGTAVHASDVHEADRPAGVKIKATVLLEPILSGGGDESLITRIPFMTVEGGCDRVSNPLSDDYFDAAHGRNAVPIHQILVHGANHNFFNTEWSPASGQVTADDDAHDPANPPGKCRTTDATKALENQLTEDQERAVGNGYLTAFMLRYLGGDTGFDPMLTGASHPLSDVTAIDVKSEAPVG